MSVIYAPPPSSLVTFQRLSMSRYFDLGYGVSLDHFAARRAPSEASPVTTTLANSDPPVSATSGPRVAVRG